MKDKMRMIEVAVEVRCVSCFVGPSAAFLATLAVLNLFDNNAQGENYKNFSMGYAVWTLLRIFYTKPIPPEVYCRILKFSRKMIPDSRPKRFNLYPILE